MALTKNRVTGLVSLIVGIIYFIATKNLPESAVSDPIGPRAFPYIISVLMIIVGLALVLKREKLTEKNKAVIFKLPEEKELVRDIAYTCVAGVVFGLILEPVGYLISTLMFMTALMFITNGRRILYNLSIGLVFSLTTYGLFFGLLDVSLPRGVLSF
ncbi:tripartite tricarboxylate transporter TctB family protein [Propionivibrio soli]|uniref:tripartite tricarboxylate transporter TctB family protein n=1 Tax=Propionivibrio soli TaxID=2976531 RepID=UPI0021E86034